MSVALILQYLTYFGQGTAYQDFVQIILNNKYYYTKQLHLLNIITEKFCFVIKVNFIFLLKIIMKSNEIGRNVYPFMFHLFFEK